jgi:hypothetical protein
MSKKYLIADLIYAVILFIGILFVCLFIVQKVMGAEFQYSLTETQAESSTTGAFRFKTEFKTDTFDYDLSYRDVNTADGRSLYGNLKADYDVDALWTLFFGFGYNDDSVINLHSLDILAGVGRYIIKNDIFKQKLSTALIIRESEALPSFRSKTNFRFWLFESDLVAQFVTNVDEFFINGFAGYHINKFVTIGYQIDYVYKDGNESYRQSVSTKISIN